MRCLIGIRLELQTEAATVGGGCRKQRCARAYLISPGSGFRSEKRKWLQTPLLFGLQ